VHDRFDNIDLLRGFAATAVVVYHVIELGKWTAFPIDGPLLTFRIGWIGVDLFYVISGFVITWSALALWRRDAGTFQGRYWARRLSRIVPLYVLTCALWIALFMPDLFAKSPTAWGGQILTHLTFTHTFFPWTYSSIDPVNWTVAIEMQFYLAIALLVPWIARVSPWRLWLVCILIAWAWRGAMFAVFGHFEPRLLFMPVMQLPGCLDEFGAGIFLARTLDDGGAERRAASGWFWLLGAIFAGTLSMSIYWRYTSYWDLPLMVTFWRTSLGVFFLCVVAAAVHLPAIAATRPLRPLAYLGVVSYGIYLWHLFAIRYALTIPGLTPPQLLAIALAITLALAMLSWHLFERPILAWGRRWRGRGALWEHPASVHGR
jgi:peptidoglycan/LPS O-acetylase OafA/YrhL